ncbi:MAG: hypothetical protein IIA58_04840 [Candidatus Marinimicrobia bacterium]|nr:hypothetical protein [Candidatus Neomarinimicrobiota bacterium]
MQQTLNSNYLAGFYQKNADFDEDSMVKMNATLEDILQVTETMMDAVKEISDIVNEE